MFDASAIYPTISQSINQKKIRPRGQSTNFLNLTPTYAYRILSNIPFARGTTTKITVHRRPQSKILYVQ